MLKSASPDGRLLAVAWLSAALLLGLGWRLQWLVAYFPAVALLGYAAYRTGDRPTRTRLLVFALPAVCLCLLLPPDLSDDHHRYLWEGFVQTEGFSPYRQTPQSLYERLDHPSEGLVNHGHLTAIYPPLAQYLFRVSTWFGDDVYAWKWVLAGILVLFCGLFPAYRWMLLAPPVLVEGFWNGHLDVVCLPAAFLLVRALERRWAIGAGLALAALIALKLLPLLLFPACFLALHARDRLRFCLALSAALLLLYLPYLGHLPDLFASFSTFARHWHFNNPLFTLLTLFVDGSWVRPAFALALLAGVLLLLLPELGVRRRLCAGWLLLIALSPTVYPWYLVWLLAFAPKGRVHWANGVYLAGFLSYLVLIPFRAGGPWQASWWWLLPEWLLMGYCALRLLRVEGRGCGDNTNE